MRILVADGVRESVRGSLRRLRDVEVVGEASGPLLTEALAGFAKPDVILVDLQSSGAMGVTTARELRDLLPEVRILVLGEGDSGSLVQQAVRVGVLGCILDRAEPAELLEAIRGAIRARQTGVLDLTGR